MNTNIRKAQSGFTLIELVIVIVILGILAAVAVPRFVDLSDEAALAAVEGVAGGLASASAINFAACAADSAECELVDDCEDTPTLMTGYDADRFDVAAEPIGTGFGDAGECTVTDVENTVTAVFQAIRTAPE